MRLAAIGIDDRNIRTKLLLMATELEDLAREVAGSPQAD